MTFIVISDDRPVLPQKEDSIEDAIMRCIERSFMLHSKAPTMREIQKTVGIASVDNVDYYVNKLIDAGYLRREEVPTHKKHGVGRGRILRLTNKRYFF